MHRHSPTNSKKVLERAINYHLIEPLSNREQNTHTSTTLVTSCSTTLMVCSEERGSFQSDTQRSVIYDTWCQKKVESYSL
jgi:hypothetical protein